MLLSAPGAGGEVLARVLAAAGAAGPADPAAVAALNDRALAAIGSGRDDPFGRRRRGAPPPPPESLVAEARALARTAEPHEPLLVLADPAAARLAELWTAALEADGWRTASVILLRPPSEAAAALSAQAGIARNRGLLLWGSSMLEAERATRGGRRVVVAYDRLRLDPEAELDRIERALALRLPRRTWDSAAEIEMLLREAPAAPPSLVAPTPQALAPLDAFADHLAAAAADGPGNADVPAETERWFDALAELAAPAAAAARRAAAPTDGPRPDEDERYARAAEALRREADEAAARAEAAEAQVAILQAALAVSRRRGAEAEALLQARATEASAGEREARAALSAAVASREAAEAELQGAHARLAVLDARAGEMAAQIGELDARLQDADARSAEADARLRDAEAQLVETRRAAAAELDDERDRHRDARDQLAVTGIGRHAALARVRELEAALAESERRRRWLSRLFGRV